MTDSTKHTIAGFLTAFLAIMGPLSALLASLQAIFATIPGHAPANYTFAIIGAVLTFLAASARIWVGLITGDANPNSAINVAGKVSVLLILALGMAHSAFAQAPASGNGFSAASGPAAVHYGGTWSPASYTVTAYDFLDFGATKNDRLFLLNTDVVVPGVFSAYHGGIGIQPDLSKLFSKTNFTDSFTIGFDASGGVATPAVGPAQASWLVGAVAGWQITPNVAWQYAEFHYGGFGGQTYPVVDTRFQFIFNPSSAAVAKSQAKRLLKAQKLVAKGQ